jgi:hypothetical protein
MIRKNQLPPRSPSVRQHATPRKQARGREPQRRYHNLSQPFQLKKL